MRFSSLTTAAATLAFALPAAAAEPAASADADASIEKRLEQMEEIIAAQRDELQQLRDEVNAAEQVQTADRDLPAVSTGIMDRVFLHAFGEWGYGITDDNEYLLGNEDGKYDNFAGGFSFGGIPHERLRIQGLVDVDDEAEVELDWLYAEWALSDLFKLRGGRSPQPFGLYSEVIQLGTVRPFFTLPRVIYGAASGMLAESYDGVGLSGSYFHDNGWGMSYDLYGGVIDIIRDIPFEEEELSELFDNMVGGRIRVHVPFDGLNLGFASFRGDSTEPGGANLFVWGFQGEYRSDNIELRSEFYRHKKSGESTTDGVYVEGAYRFLEHFQIASRFEWSDADILTDDTGLPFEIPEDLLEHMEVGVGLNYWVTPNLVLKTSYHHVWGNRFANPPADELVPLFLAMEPLDDTTNLFLAGLQFSF